MALARRKRFRHHAMSCLEGGRAFGWAIQRVQYDEPLYNYIIDPGDHRYIDLTAFHACKQRRNCRKASLLHSRITELTLAPGIHRQQVYRLSPVSRE